MAFNQIGHDMYADKRYPDFWKPFERRCLYIFKNQNLCRFTPFFDNKCRVSFEVNTHCEMFDHKPIHVTYLQLTLINNKEISQNYFRNEGALGLMSYVREKRLCDFEIMCQGKSFLVHKLVLSGYLTLIVVITMISDIMCPFFEAMIEFNIKSGQNKVCIFVNASFISFMFFCSILSRLTSLQRKQ